MNEFATDPSLGGQAESTQGAEAQPQRVSLDGLSEFDYQGETLTPDRLQEVFKGYKSYEQVQRQLAEETRYKANLRTDLESVRQDPSLAQKFKSIYPREYHDLVDMLMSGQTQATQTQGAIPKEVMARFAEVDNLKASIQQMAIESANAKLDAILPKLYEKYPLANEDQVLARAEAMLSNGAKLTDQAWERIAKESHEAMTKKSDAYYKKQLQTQQDKGQAGKDAGVGGSVPGKAPMKFKDFDGAREGMIAELKRQGWT